MAEPTGAPIPPPRTQAEPPAPPPPPYRPGGVVPGASSARRTVEVSITPRVDAHALEAAAAAYEQAAKALRDCAARLQALAENEPAEDAHRA